MERSWTSGTMALAQLDSAAEANVGPGVVTGDPGRWAGPQTGIRAKVSSGDIRPCSGKSGAQVAGTTGPLAHRER